MQDFRFTDADLPQKRCASLGGKDAHLSGAKMRIFRKQDTHLSRGLSWSFRKRLVISADGNPITLAGKPSARGNQSFWNLEAGTNSALLMLSLNEVEKRQFTFSFLMSEAVTSSGLSTPSLDAETENDAQSPIFTE